MATDTPEIESSIPASELIEPLGAVVCSEADERCDPKCNHRLPHAPHKRRCKCGSCDPRHACAEDDGYCEQAGKAVRCIPVAPNDKHDP